MATEGKIYNRTMFYEKIPDSSNGGERIRLLPFYLVTIPDLGGRIFEPMDYGKPVTDKEIRAMVQYDGKSKIGCCEERSDGTDLPLHSFGGWEYPAIERT